jgi:hypothetical protein
MLSVIGAKYHIFNVMLSVLVLNVVMLSAVTTTQLFTVPIHTKSKQALTNAWNFNLHISKSFLSVFQVEKNKLDKKMQSR